MKIVTNRQAEGVEAIQPGETEKIKAVSDQFSELNLDFHLVMLLYRTAPRINLKLTQFPFLFYFL